MFQFIEEALDLVALAVERLGPSEALLASDHVGNIGDAAARLYVASQPVGVIRFVGDNDCAAAEIRQERFGAGQVMGLSGRDQELDRPALAVDTRVDFRAEATAASPHTAISTLFLTPEACW